MQDFYIVVLVLLFLLQLSKATSKKGKKKVKSQNLNSRAKLYFKSHINVTKAAFFHLRTIAKVRVFLRCRKTCSCVYFDPSSKTMH